MAGKNEEPRECSKRGGKPTTTTLTTLREMDPPALATYKYLLATCRVPGKKEKRLMISLRFGKSCTQSGSKGTSKLPLSGHFQEQTLRAGQPCPLPDNLPANNHSRKNSTSPWSTYTIHQLHTFAVPRAAYILTSPALDVSSSVFEYASIRPSRSMLSIRLGSAGILNSRLTSSSGSGARP
jgi:hypothetical protein